MKRVEDLKIKDPLFRVEKHISRTENGFFYEIPFIKKYTILDMRHEENGWVSIRLARDKRMISNQEVSAELKSTVIKDFNESYYLSEADTEPELNQRKKLWEKDFKQLTKELL